MDSVFISMWKKKPKPQKHLLANMDNIIHEVT